MDTLKSDLRYFQALRALAIDWEMRAYYTAIINQLQTAKTGIPVKKLS